MRFFITLFICKIYYYFQKNKVSDRVGMLALKLCPDFLMRVAKPKTNVCITGTNGKTTTTTMICDCFIKNGYSVVTTYGTNLHPGIVKTLISQTSWLNKSKVDVGVFECDENSIYKFLPAIKPEYLVITNLSVDNIIRTGNIDFVYRDVERAVKENPDVKLIINGDDLICSQLLLNRNNKGDLVYSLDPLKDEKQGRETLFKDVAICPKCQHKLEYTFTRYFNIAKAQCPNCGYHNPISSYVGNNVNFEKMTMQINDETYPLIGKALHYLYNQICTTVVAKAYGLKNLQDIFANMVLEKTRLWEPTFGKYHVHFRMAKGLNPVALSVNYNEVANDKRKKSVIIWLDDPDYRASDNLFEDVLYIYPADYEALNSDSIDRLIFAGQLCQHEKLRALIAGIDEKKIFTCDNEHDAHNFINLDIEDVYVLFDRANYNDLKNWEKDLQKYLEAVK